MFIDSKSAHTLRSAGVKRFCSRGFYKHSALGLADLVARL